MAGLLSCWGIPSDVRKAFTYCYSGTYTGLDTLINLDGYYHGPSMIFYTNGMVVSPSRLNFSYNNVTFSKDASLFFQGITGDPEAKDSKRFFSSVDCGGYVICGDTIKVQLIHKSYSINDNWSGDEEWYKIIDRNTLQLINWFPVTTNKKELERFKKYYSLPAREIPATNFTPVSIKPQPDYFWILKEKWFWCNEQDWKAYMDEIKRKKVEVKN